MSTVSPRFRPKIILISGPSAAGKTTLVRTLTEKFPDRYEHIRQDDYLKDPATFPREGEHQVWEVPENIMWDTLCAHLCELLAGKEVVWRTFAKDAHEPVYTYTIKPKQFILIDGSLIFTDEAIRNMADMKIYIDISLESSLERRALRARAWSLDIAAYDQTVFIPFYHKYRSLREYADHCVDGNRPSDAIAEEVHTLIERVYS